MVKEQDIEELENLLRFLRGVIRRLNSLKQMSWKVPIEIPWTEEVIEHRIPETKKQKIIKEAKDRLKELKKKINSINWDSLD